MNVCLWNRFEARFSGPSEGNPYAEVSFGAVFRHMNRTVPADGFYDGSGEYVIRFMPDAEGEWTYVTTSDVPALNGLTGGFTCTPPEENVHGPVYVGTCNSDKFHSHVDATRFKYADGTPFSCVGTTCYCWTHQGDELEEKTLATLSKGYFNKIRMCLFPKHYAYNRNEPEYFPFAGGKKGEGYEWDFTRFVPEYWAHLEKRIDQLAEMGIEADLILFHPYDRWGFSAMSRETDLFYLRYVVARLASFRNVWWSFANEYDLMPAKSMGDWDEYIRFVQSRDPAQHLRSIHNCRQFYDHSKPWITHCSIQNVNMEMVPGWLNTYNKPVVIDECCYEGDIPNYWGSIPAIEMVNRMWCAFVWGGYGGHGETYLNDEEILWWSKGGELHGQAPQRIKFMRGIIESLPGDPTPAMELSRVMGLNFNEEQYLYYYSLRQSSVKVVNLPEGKKYRAEVIDAWNMTVTPVEGVFSGEGARIPMPGKSYCALRIYRVG